MLEQHLLDLRESSSDEINPDALLFEILIKQGYSLSEKINTVKIGDLEVKSIGEGLVLAVVNVSTKPSLEALKEIIEQKPAKFVILEDIFQGDDELKTNLLQECRSRGIELWTA
jgi:adenine-specific DNA-methyltransferase